VTQDIEVTRTHDGCIHLQGFRDDVIRVKDTIHSLVIEEYKKQQKKVEKIFKTPNKNIQWEYQDSNNKWTVFSLYISYHIEETFEQDNKRVKIKSISKKV
jgi:hypothetical protein